MILRRSARDGRFATWKILLADPYNVIEFAERGAHEPNMTTYLAFETMLHGTKQRKSLP